MCDVRLGLKKSPFLYINCVSWDRLYLEDRFESNGRRKGDLCQGCQCIKILCLKQKAYHLAP